MNAAEISELRRRFKPDKTAITAIRGCYVNDSSSIVSQFSQSMSMLKEGETEEYLGFLRKTLSGKLDRNLLNLEFTTEQVTDSPEHHLMMTLRDSALQDEEAVAEFYEKVIGSVSMETGYLILIATEAYDVPYRGKDNVKVDDASDTLFTYLIAAVCPVKQPKPTLAYCPEEDTFRSRAGDPVVAAPDMGFLFPAFDDRAANLYGALLYTRDADDTREEFVSAVFGAEAPEPADAQREQFQSLLYDALGDECSYDVVHSLHTRFLELEEEHKANKAEEPLRISQKSVSTILRRSGVSAERIAAFESRYETDFGQDREMNPGNLIDLKKIALTAGDASVQVSSVRGDLVETRVIDGARYILIRVEDDVDVNGVPILIRGEKAAPAV